VYEVAVTYVGKWVKCLTHQAKAVPVLWVPPPS
jgi:hypothetical protein